MPAKPAPIKKAAKKELPAKKVEKAPEPAPEPEPAPVEPAPAPAPVEAAPAPVEPEAAPAAVEEAPPVEEAPAETPAEGAAEAPAEVVVEAPPPPPPADSSDAVEATADPEASTDPAANADPATETPVAEEPKAPTPPPPPPKEPTSAPLDLFIEDKNDTSVSIIWSQPETVGDSGLDGYLIEVCKDGTEDWKAVNEELHKSTRYAIKNQTTGDKLKIRVVAVNAGGRSAPGALPDAVLVKEVANRPKVRMPRFLRQRYVAKVGDKINLTIPFTGKPKPVVTWSKDGQPLDTKRVQVRSTDHDSILFIRVSVREDSGIYEMSVKVDDFEDKATLILQIVELPGAPATVKIVDTWGFNVALEWTPPGDNGNTDITGYTIQKADKKTGDWFTVLDHYHRLNATISDLIMGNIYKFRVFSENKVGMSDAAVVTKGEAAILKTDIDYKPLPFTEHDYSEPPKFTVSLADRAATVGYSTKLLCSVRGSPKPKIEWLKNQMIIGDDPKYRQICVQGICTLEIRKPGNFDGGVYMCRAKNSCGEATVHCKLEVKQPINPDAEKK